MKEDKQAVELQETYQKLDAEGRKKLVLAAVQLLNAQKLTGKEPLDTITIQRIKPPKTGKTRKK